MVNYITPREASKKWGITDRRIRALLHAGRIDGAKRDGELCKLWLIPDDAPKPADGRYSIPRETIFVKIPDGYFDLVNGKLSKLNSARPLSAATLKSIKAETDLQWTYNSNAIEGNTLTLRETKVVLEGITIGGKSVREHLEAINHKDAIDFLEELVSQKQILTERDIKDIHSIILRKIDPQDSGRYRSENVIISGTTHKPPEHYLIQEQMEQMMLRYKKWENLHPIIRSAYLHGEFVKIHPFIDGNGRTSRLIMNFELIRAGFPPVIIKKENRLEYYDALDMGATTGNYTDFVIQITKYVTESLDKYLALV